MKNCKLFLLAIVGIFLMNSCANDELNIPVYTPKGTYDSGAFVVNEGGFGSSNASISFLSFDLNTFQNNVFAAANPSITLGNTAQSIGFNGDLAYIVVNASNKIQIVNRYTMVNVGSITSGLTNPRYISFANGKAFVTCWGTVNATGPDAGDDYVAVVNLNNNTIAATIPVVEGPEQMVLANNNLYVSHKGAYGFGATLSVINTTTNTIATTINVGDVPSTMVIENNSLWVLCEGKRGTPATETGGKLQKINLANNTVISTFSFATTAHPSNLVLYNKFLYYTIGSDVYKMPFAPIAPATSIALPTAPVLLTNAIVLYGFAIKNNKIYVSDAKDYVSNGKVTIFSLGEITDSPAFGTLLRTYESGIIPNGFYFNQ